MKTVKRLNTIPHPATLAAELTPLAGSAAADIVAGGYAFECCEAHGESYPDALARLASHGAPFDSGRAAEFAGRIALRVHGSHYIGATAHRLNGGAH